MKPSNVITIIVIVVIAWASLFITVLSSVSKLNHSLEYDRTLLDQDTVILKAQHQTQADLEAKIDNLQAHDDCLFKLATTPNHSSSTIISLTPCQIASHATNITTGPTTNQAPAPVVEPITQKHDNPPPSNPPPPSQPFLQRDLVQPIISIFNRAKGLL